MLGIQTYSSYTIISVLLSWLNQPFPMVGWPFTRDEYSARWGGGPSQRLAPKTGRICYFQPEAEVAACRTRECFQVPLGRQSFRVTCLRQFQSRGPEQVTLLPSLLEQTSQGLPAPEAQLRTMLLSETVRLVSVV